MVGKPSLTGLRKGCPSLGQNRKDRQAWPVCIRGNLLEKRSGLLRESDPAQQVLETRIAAQRVVDRVNLDSNDGVGMLRIGLLQ